MAETYTFSPVTATDRAGLVWVASILSLMFSVLTLLTRFQLKLHSLGQDDWAIAAATAIGLGQYCAVFVGLSKGVGKSSVLLEQSYAATLGESVLASEVLFVLSLLLSKLSVVFFMKRLFTPDNRFRWWCCNVAAVITLAWGIGGALGISIGCGSPHILYGSRRCADKVSATVLKMLKKTMLSANYRMKMLRWRLVIALDGVLEVAYVALAIALVWPLRMKRHIKVTVVCAFASRLVCAAFAALHGYWIARYIESPDPGLAIANVLVWQQIELGYSLIATTIPTLRGFVRGYTKARGWNSSYEKQKDGQSYSLGSNPKAANGSGLASKHTSRIHDYEGETLQLGPHVGEYRVGAFHDASKGTTGRRIASAESVDSEDPIIWRNISVSVEHERASRSNSHVQLAMK